MLASSTTMTRPRTRRMRIAPCLLRLWTAAPAEPAAAKRSFSTRVKRRRAAGSDCLVMAWLLAAGAPWGGGRAGLKTTLRAHRDRQERDLVAVRIVGGAGDPTEIVDG